MGYPRKNIPEGLPFCYTDYLELADWTGRILSNDKRGAIPVDTPEILSRLNIKSKHQGYLAKNIESSFKSLRVVCIKLANNWEKAGHRVSTSVPDYFRKHRF